MKNVQHEEDGAWVITNDDHTSTRVEFYKDEAGISIYTHRIDPKFGPINRAVVLDEEEMALLKQYLLTPEEEAGGSVAAS